MSEDDLEWMSKQHLLPVRRRGQTAVWLDRSERKARPTTVSGAKEAASVLETEGLTVLTSQEGTAQAAASAQVVPTMQGGAAGDTVGADDDGARRRAPAARQRRPAARRS